MPNSPLNVSQSRFTAARIASVAGMSKRGLLPLLKAAPSSVQVMRGGPVRTYSIADLPSIVREKLADRAAGVGVSCPELLQTPSILPTPTISLRDVAPESLQRAANLQRALLPSLARRANKVLTPDEFTALGLSDYAGVFGHEITPRHWRSLLDRTINRDAGVGQFQRIELYLDENPKRAKPDLQPEGDTFCELDARISSFAHVTRPAKHELKSFWVDVMDWFDSQQAAGIKPKHAKRELIQFLERKAPFLGPTEKAIRLKFERRLERWGAEGGNLSAVADRREENGRTAPELSKDDRMLLIARAVELQGNLAMAWRDLMGGWICRNTGKRLSQTIRDHYSTARSKSYVPLSIRRQVTPEVRLLLCRHQGPRCARLAGAFVDRDPTTFDAGDWFQSDDATLENYFWDTDLNGEPFVTRGQFLAMIDCRTTFILAFVIIPERQYTAFHIRNLISTTNDAWGLPRKGFYFENGLWRRAKLIVGPKAEAVDWDTTRMGLRGLGLRIEHARLPRAKVIERVYGIYQSFCRTEPGWASNDERRHLPEKLKRELSLIERKKEHPGKFLYSKQQWMAKLQEICDRYNAEVQNGKYLPGLTPWEGYQKFYGTPLVKLQDDCRYLLASQKSQEKVGRNGITLRYGKTPFTYKSALTGELEGREVFAWFNPENPAFLSVTALDGKHPFVVPRSTLPPGMDAPREVLAQALRENAEHNSYRNALYIVMTPHKSAEFEKKQFRKTVAERQTVERGGAFRAQTEQAQKEIQAEQRTARAVKADARQLGVAEVVTESNPDVARGLELMKQLQEDER